MYNGSRDDVHEKIRPDIALHEFAMPDQRAQERWYRTVCTFRGICGTDKHHLPRREQANMAGTPHERDTDISADLRPMRTSARWWSCGGQDLGKARASNLKIGDRIVTWRKCRLRGNRN